MYYFIKNKLGTKTYSSVLLSLKNSVDDFEINFRKLTIHDQCEVLRQLLKAFKCNRETSNIEKLNKVKQAGIIIISNSITNSKSFKLIHQSITGLFEKEVDLLK